MDDEGAAYLEALVVVPVLGLLLAGVVSLNAMYGAKLEAKARARRVAWLRADSGDCPASPCRTGKCQAIEADIRVGGLDAIGISRASGYALQSFVGDVRDFFMGRTTTGTGSAVASTPVVAGSRNTTQRGANTLLCNTTRRKTSSGDSILDHACSTGLSETEYAREVCR